jgi:hypothetical protein
MATWFAASEPLQSVFYSLDVLKNTVYSNNSIENDLGRKNVQAIMLSLSIGGTLTYSEHIF